MLESSRYSRGHRIIEMKNGKKLAIVFLSIILHYVDECLLLSSHEGRKPLKVEYGCVIVLNAGKGAIQTLKYLIDNSQHKDYHSVQVIFSLWILSRCILIGVW